MAQLFLEPGTDVRRLKKELKRIGFVLRSCKQSDGTISYRLHCNTYAKEVNMEELLNLLQGL